MFCFAFDERIQCSSRHAHACIKIIIYLAWLYISEVSAGAIANTIHKSCSQYIDRLHGKGKAISGQKKLKCLKLCWEIIQETNKCKNATRKIALPSCNKRVIGLQFKFHTAFQQEIELPSKNDALQQSFVVKTLFLFVCKPTLKFAFPTFWAFGF